MTEADAAALALVGITAHLGLFWRTNLQAGETVFVNGGTGGVGVDGGADGEGGGGEGDHHRRQRGEGELAAELRCRHGASTTRPTTWSKAVKDATDGRGVDVWFETLPPTDLDRTVEMMAPRGRVVVMAGRQARPVFPNGPFYVKGLSLFGFVMFAMTADEQRACANDMNTWMASGKLKPLIGADVPAERSGRRPPIAGGEHGRQGGHADRQDRGDRADRRRPCVATRTIRGNICTHDHGPGDLKNDPAPTAR